MYKHVSLVIASTLLATSCASIVSRSSYPINVTSTPSAAQFTITDKKGKVVYNGTTPQTVTLKSGRGYFKSAKYEVKFEKGGYATKTYSLVGDINGWYFGNIIFGGLIGLLIVDPITGAMYKLPKSVDVPLEAEHTQSDGALKVVLISALPQELRDQLIPIN